MKFLCYYKILPGRGEETRASGCDELGRVRGLRPARSDATTPSAPRRNLLKFGGHAAREQLIIVVRTSSLWNFRIVGAERGDHGVLP